MKLKTKLLFVLMFLASAPLYSQISEIGVMAGVTYYKGDLNKKHFKKIGNIHYTIA